MAGVSVAANFWQGKRVLITGHTGFKGGWLALWLASLGAEIYGFSIQPPSEPNLFSVADVRSVLTRHMIGDIRDLKQLTAAMTLAQPEIVLHLAAQSLVRNSYKEPVETYATNVLGTVHVLEAVRHAAAVRAVVIVTTDKCYENREQVRGYRESDALGGYDPYSSSKGCAELVTSAYRASFFRGSRVAVASARAGNVIGGGDWAMDRLVPDFFRAAGAGQRLEVRNPQATRPWQHVLEPLSGYIVLAERLLQHGSADAEAWNFGPADDDAKPVSWLLEYLSHRMPGTNWYPSAQQHPHEAEFLQLDSSKARVRLCWAPRWTLSEALERTVEWHLAWRANRDMRRISLEQIAAHQRQSATQPLK